MRCISRVMLGIALCQLAIILPAAAQFFQQGDKLVGTGAANKAQQGASVSLSADGNTAIVGGPNDNSPNSIGASWVYTRSGGIWTQQGAKLAGTGVSGTWGSAQGASVALSANGNTAIVGGPADGFSTGAAWVFIRSAGVWSQQAKLFGLNPYGSAYEGSSVALSADGNTAIVGGPGDRSDTGAVWFFTRNGTSWTQQGTKRAGTDAVGAARQGSSVSLSSDGNTALFGGFPDNGDVGAAWVFTRTAGVWSQQGPKLVGTGAVGSSSQGYSVALSGDGNTAIVGGVTDSGTAGAAWIFTRTSGVWTQEGSKLVGTGAVGYADQGYSVSLSAHGDTAMVGGPFDDSYMGAVWIFTRNAGVWSQLGTKLVGSGAAYLTYTWPYVKQGTSVSLAADGNTAFVGASNDSMTTGAAWAFFTGVAQNYSVKDRWNLVSVPLTVSDYLKIDLYPSAQSSAWGYAGNYVAKDTLVNGAGYWLKFNGNQSIQMRGVLISLDTFDVAAGWNLIGSISTAVPVPSITSDPGGLITSDFYGYANAKGYYKVDSIKPGFGYWVNVQQSGKIILSSAPAIGPQSRIRIVGSGERPPSAPYEVAGEGERDIPVAFVLEQNSPNPFNPSTIINYQLPVDNYVTLNIYDVLGQRVATLVDGVQPAGYKSVTWDARNFASGIYFYRLEAGNISHPVNSFIQIRKMVLLK